MVIRYLHFGCVARKPSEANAKLLVDADCVLALSIDCQGMQIQDQAGSADRRATATPQETPTVFAPRRATPAEGLSGPTSNLYSRRYRACPCLDSSGSPLFNIIAHRAK